MTGVEHKILWGSPHFYGEGQCKCEGCNDIQDIQLQASLTRVGLCQGISIVISRPICLLKVIDETGKDQAWVEIPKSKVVDLIKILLRTLAPLEQAVLIGSETGD